MGTNDTLHLFESYEESERTKTITNEVNECITKLTEILDTLNNFKRRSRPDQRKKLAHTITVLKSIKSFISIDFPTSIITPLAHSIDIIGDFLRSINLNDPTLDFNPTLEMKLSNINAELKEVHSSILNEQIHKKDIKTSYEPILPDSFISSLNETQFNIIKGLYEIKIKELDQTVTENNQRIEELKESTKEVKKAAEEQKQAIDENTRLVTAMSFNLQSNILSSQFENRQHALLEEKKPYTTWAIRLAVALGGVYLIFFICQYCCLIWGDSSDNGTFSLNYQNHLMLIAVCSPFIFLDVWLFFQVGRYDHLIELYTHKANLAYTLKTAINYTLDIEGDTSSKQTTLATLHELLQELYTCPVGRHGKGLTAKGIGEVAGLIKEVKELIGTLKGDCKYDEKETK